MNKFIYILKEFSKVIFSIKSNLLTKRINTYCHMLWDSVFVDNKGNVYTCCHYKPWKFGNIYNKKLSKIISSSIRLKIYKFLSLNKCLFCYFKCTLISDERKDIRPTYEEISDGPRSILVLCGELCNISCIMCPQDHRSRDILDAEIAKKNIEWSQFEDIMFQGGEILAMKEAKDLFLWLTKQMNKKVNLLTNGLLIDDEWVENLVEGANVLAISVNACTKETHELVNKGSNFDKVVNNIKKLVRYRDLNKTGTQIIYKFSIVPENVHEVADAISFANNLGCDEISYGYDLSVPEYIKNNETLRLDVVTSVDSVMDADVDIKVDLPKLKLLGLAGRSS